MIFYTLPIARRIEEADQLVDHTSSISVRVSVNSCVHDRCKAPDKRPSSTVEFSDRSHWPKRTSFTNMVTSNKIHN